MSAAEVPDMFLNNKAPEPPSMDNLFREGAPYQDIFINGAAETDNAVVQAHHSEIHAQIGHEKGASAAPGGGTSSLSGPAGPTDGPAVSGTEPTLSGMNADTSTVPPQIAKRPHRPVMRCDYSDLPPDSCGHCLGTPDLPSGLSADSREGKPGGAGRGAARPYTDASRPTLPLALEGTWTIAAFSGECGCGCGQRIEEGDEICMISAAGSVWALTTCTRAWEVAP